MMTEAKYPAHPILAMPMRIGLLGYALCAQTDGKRQGRDGDRGRGRAGDASG